MVPVGQIACPLGLHHNTSRLAVMAWPGRAFTVRTDHKPLTFTLSRVTDPWSARQQRQLSYVAEFTNRIENLPGKQNVVADMLSRSSSPAPVEGGGAPPGMPSGSSPSSFEGGGAPHGTPSGSSPSSEALLHMNVATIRSWVHVH